MLVWQNKVFDKILMLIRHWFWSVTYTGGMNCNFWKVIFKARDVIVVKKKAVLRIGPKSLVCVLLNWYLMTVKAKAHDASLQNHLVTQVPFFFNLSSISIISLTIISFKAILHLFFYHYCFTIFTAMIIKYKLVNSRLLNWKNIKFLPLSCSLMAIILLQSLCFSK